MKMAVKLKALADGPSGEMILLDLKPRLRIRVVEPEPVEPLVDSPYETFVQQINAWLRQALGSSRIDEA